MKEVTGFVSHIYSALLVGEFLSPCYIWLFSMFIMANLFQIQIHQNLAVRNRDQASSPSGNRKWFATAVFWWNFPFGRIVRIIENSLEWGKMLKPGVNLFSLWVSFCVSVFRWFSVSLGSRPANPWGFPWCFFCPEKNPSTPESQSVDTLASQKDEVHIPSEFRKFSSLPLKPRGHVNFQEGYTPEKPKNVECGIWFSFSIGWFSGSSRWNFRECNELNT